MNRRKTSLSRIAWLTTLAFALLIHGCGSSKKHTSVATQQSVLPVKIEGRAEPNGKTVEIASQGSFNALAGSYEISNTAPADKAVDMRDKLLLSFIPRSALTFLGGKGVESLLDKSNGRLNFTLTATRKVDETSKIFAMIELLKNPNGLTVRYTGTVTTQMGGDRAIQPDGEAVMRRGVNPDSGKLVGGARIHYDLTHRDPASLATPDFWTLQAA